MQYPIHIQKSDNNYSACSPDVPGCVAVGDTIEEVRQQIVEALKFHFEGLLEDNDPIPQPETIVEYAEVEIPTAVSQT